MKSKKMYTIWANTYACDDTWIPVELATAYTERATLRKLEEIEISEGGAGQYRDFYITVEYV